MTDDKILKHPDLVLTEAQVEELLRWAFEAYPRSDAFELDLAARAVQPGQSPLIQHEQLPRPYTVELQTQEKPYTLSISSYDLWFLSHPVLCEWRSGDTPTRALVILSRAEIGERELAFGEISLLDTISGFPKITCPLFPESLKPDEFVALYNTAHPLMRPDPSTLADWLSQIELPPRKRKNWKGVLATLHTGG